MSSKSFIKLEQVTKHFKDPSTDINFQALRGIDISINVGEFVSIIGPSGAGKSTLLNILGGMQQPSTGKLFVDGIPLHQLGTNGSEFYRRDVVGFLWQLPLRNLLPGLTAFDNVLTSLMVSNYPKDEREMRVKEVLTAVGLKDRMYHKLGELSGGEAQRASLAVAIAKKPKILLADEPTGELDSETTLDIIRYLRQANDELNMTVVVVTHDERFAKMTDKSYKILDGAIASINRMISKDISEKDWNTVERDEVSVVDQFGTVRIPRHLVEQFKIGEYVKFEVKDDCLCIRPILKEEE